MIAFHESRAAIFDGLAEHAVSVSEAASALMDLTGDRADPDRELLDLCRQLTAMQAEWQRLYKASSDAVDLASPADHAWQAYNDDVWPRTGMHSRDCITVDVPAKLLTMRATTMDGMVAKAVAILAMDDAGRYTHDIRDDSSELQLSLLEDVAGAARVRMGEDAGP